FVSVIIAVHYSRTTYFQAILAISAGAVVMIYGYFLYSTFAFTWFDNLLTGGTAPLVNYQAIMNVPFDILQCVVGSTIATIVYQAIAKGSVLAKLEIS
nr:hypothetical protein [Candidatus Sigynarchaeota archaeon]